MDSALPFKCPKQVEQRLQPGPVLDSQSLRRRLGQGDPQYEIFPPTVWD